MRNDKGQFIKGHIVSEEMRLKISLSKKGKISNFKGKKHTEEAKEKIKLAHFGKKPNNALEIWKEKGGQPWNKGLKGIHLSPKTEFKKNDKRITKENNSNWRGGISDINSIIRRSKEYAEWRNSIYARDNYICQHCGKKCQANNIIAHHLYYFSKVPELRFSLENGITLCRSCHFKLHQKNKSIDGIFYQTIMKPKNYQFVVGQNL